LTARDNHEVGVLAFLRYLGGGIEANEVFPLGVIDSACIKSGQQCREVSEYKRPDTAVTPYEVRREALSIFRLESPTLQVPCAAIESSIPLDEFVHPQRHGVHSLDEFTHPPGELIHSLGEPLDASGKLLNAVAQTGNNPRQREEVIGEDGVADTVAEGILRIASMNA
jgi:hypothetical protein